MLCARSFEEITALVVYTSPKSSMKASMVGATVFHLKNFFRFS